MSLDTDQQAALVQLASLITEEETGIVRVLIDPEDRCNETPYLEISDDEGMFELRTGGGIREITWPLHITVHIDRGDLADAHQTGRSIRARLIDRLGDDIPLGGHCHHTAWQEGLQVVDLTREDDGVHEVGVDGVYELVFHSTRTFA